MAAPEASGALSDLARQLEVFDVSTAYPLVFVIASSHAEDDEKAVLYRLISSYVVRRALCGLTPKAFNNTFVRVAGHLRAHGVSRASFASVFADSPGDTVWFPTDGELREAIHNREQYGQLPTARLRYVLGELEKASRGVPDEALGLRGDLTIEHVLPQDWAEHWLLPDGSRAPLDRIVAADDSRHALIADRELLKDTLGNLTLLTTSGNPRLGNRPFGTAEEGTGISKREALRGSMLKMNVEILCKRSLGRGADPPRAGTYSRHAQSLSGRRRKRFTSRTSGRASIRRHRSRNEQRSLRTVNRAICRSSQRGHR